MGKTDQRYIKKVQDDLRESARIKLALAKTVDKDFIEICSTIADCFRAGNKVLICGNGGSAADAQHLAAEFVNYFAFQRDALAAIALTTDSSVMTSIANDTAYESIFSRQVSALGRTGDVLIVFSTSGNSLNVIRAVEEAKKRRMITIGFVGEGGGKIGKIAQYCVRVPSNSTPRIQEAHQTLYHIIAGIVEQMMFSKEKDEE